MQKLLVIVLLVAFILPSYGEAASRRNRVDTSSLDDDPVKTFPPPVLFGVKLSDIYPDFGGARGGGTREHEGQDIRAPKGTPIVSPTEAVVLSTGKGSSAGNYVYTANPGGEVFRYMHLDTIADIEPGDELSIGDLIGTVGDTGNAPEGVYHLHLEVRDDDNDPTDPYERFEETFSIKKKMSFLKDILRDVDEDKDDYAEFLVAEFESDFSEALAEGYRLPDEIENAIEDNGLAGRQDLLVKLNQLIDSIPALLVRDISVGDSGSEVLLLQTYLIFRSSGEAHERLVATGATGYYGSLTSAAVAGWQAAEGLSVSGIWRGDDRLKLVK